MSALYEIPDEPRASPLARYATDPLWPLLGLALAGPAIGFVWLMFNAAALGSRDRWTQASYALGAYIGSRIGMIAVALAAHQGALDGVAGAEHAPLVAILLLVCVDGATLFAGFVIMVRQSIAAELHAFFGRPLKNLFPIALIAWLVAMWIPNTPLTILLLRFAS